MKTKLLIASLLVAPQLMGCAGFAFSGRGVPMAGLYSGASVNEHVTQNRIGTKRGEACATSILGLVTTGDASAAAAARAAGIQTIGAVDQDYTNVLGLYAKYCTVVTGD